MNYTHKTGARIVAYIIDIILVGIVARIFSTLGIVSVGNVAGLNWIETVIVMGVYFVGFAYFNEGRTVGKILLNLEVSTVDITHPTRKDLIVRELLKSVLAPISWISALLIIFSGSHQGIHDMLTSTVTLPVGENNYNAPKTKSFEESKEKSDEFDYYE